MKRPITPLPQRRTKRDWHVLDASQQTLGRLAATAAALLTGKHRADFSTHIDTGDFVVITNAAKMRFTGGKDEKKLYHHYSGYPGGLYTKTLAERLEQEPTEVIRDAVKGMLGKNRLQKARLQRLNVYRDSKHPHTDAVVS